jgi:hypothetical protein
MRVEIQRNDGSIQWSNLFSRDLSANVANGTFSLYPPSQPGMLGVASGAAYEIWCVNDNWFAHNSSTVNPLNDAFWQDKPRKANGMLPVDMGGRLTVAVNSVLYSGGFPNRVTFGYTNTSGLTGYIYMRIQMQMATGTVVWSNVFRAYIYTGNGVSTFDVNVSNVNVPGGGTKSGFALQAQYEIRSVIAPCVVNNLLNTDARVADYDWTSVPVCLSGELPPPP